MAKKITPASLFRLEDHLLDVVYNQIESRVKASRHVAAKQMKVAVGMIVPDLILVTHPGKISRNALRRFRLTLFDCGLLSQLVRTNSPTLEKLAEEVTARHSVIQSSLLKLERCGLIKTRGRRITVSRKMRFQSARIVAVEAKLIRWKDAIEQAQSYLKFSNAAYVAMPGPLIARNRAIRKACAAARIGLLAVSGRKCKISLRAPSSISRSGEWIWLLNKICGLEF